MLELELMIDRPGRQPGWRNLSLSAESGTVTVLSGSVGCGTSTLLRALIGDLPPGWRARGRAELDGTPLRPGHPGLMFLNCEQDLRTDETAAELFCRSAGSRTPSDPGSRPFPEPGSHTLPELVEGSLATPATFPELVEGCLADPATFPEPVEGSLATPATIPELVEGSTPSPDQLIRQLGLARWLHTPLHHCPPDVRHRARLAAVLAGRPRWLLLDQLLGTQPTPWRTRVIEAVGDQVRRGMGVLWAEHEPEVVDAADRVVEASGTGLRPFDKLRDRGALGQGPFDGLGDRGGLGQGPFDRLRDRGRVGLRGRGGVDQGPFDKLRDRGEVRPLDGLQERASSGVLERSADRRRGRTVGGQVFPVDPARARLKGPQLRVAAGEVVMVLADDPRDAARLVRAWHRDATGRPTDLGLQALMTHFSVEEVVNRWASEEEEEHLLPRLARSVAGLRPGVCASEHSAGEQTVIRNELLLADQLAALIEPTRGLDAAARRALSTRVHQRAARGRTTMIATSDHAFATGCGTRQIAIQDRKVVDGPPQTEPAEVSHA